MSDLQNFPKLQDKRLSLIGKQTHRLRKTTSINNDKLKNKCITYGKAVDKDKRSYDYKMWQKSMPHKQFYIHSKGTQKCLKRIRDQVPDLDDESSLYGVYGGVSLRDLQPQIDTIIREQHPKVRRIKKTEKLLTDGKTDGRILGNKEARGMLEAILNRPSFPPRRERGMTLYIRARRPSTVDTNEITSAGALRLPPIAVSRENTRSGLVFRPKSKPIMLRDPPKRSTTFALGL
ncbi:uncharacterized protein LOC133202428 [Saccostrea echinata]|uniref:uncharacterized protein LOC133202428 n=1 Tax=Saccostrea echinata TaxID=191078 RepID=UPI002A7F37D8|nr:uncharacterized protein LOC133202428 [Saccostrea echinata]